MAENRCVAYMGTGKVELHDIDFPTFERPGSAYGYVDMGGWVGGQAEYVLVPYADWNLLKFPEKDQAVSKILDLTMLSDIFPTEYHGCYTAGVTSGSTVYIAGAGPVGLAAAHSAQLLGPPW